MIELRDVEFRYGDGASDGFALRIQKLRVEPAERLSLTGPSGSGKTTLLQLIAGIHTPLRGSVKALDTRVDDLEQAQRRRFRIQSIGLVFQEFELLDYLSVLDNILLPFRISGALRLNGAARERAHELAGRVGLADKVSRLASRLSQGERQRVAVCRALVTQPRLLLADEPTGNLDAENRDRVVDVLLGYARESQATLIAVTHDRELHARFDRSVDVRKLD